MSKEKKLSGVPRTKVEREPDLIPFSKTHQRLLRTITTKHNQAMQHELNTALVEIYDELGIDKEKLADKYELDMSNWSGLKKRKVTHPPPVGDIPKTSEEKTDE